MKKFQGLVCRAFSPRQKKTALLYFAGDYAGGASPYLFRRRRFGRRVLRESRTRETVPLTRPTTSSPRGGLLIREDRRAAGLIAEDRRGVAKRVE